MEKVYVVLGNFDGESWIYKIFDSEILAATCAGILNIEERIFVYTVEEFCVESKE